MSSDMPPLTRAQIEAGMAEVDKRASMLMNYYGSGLTVMDLLVKPQEIESHTDPVREGDLNKKCSGCFHKKKKCVCSNKKPSRNKSYKQE